MTAAVEVTAGEARQARTPEHMENAADAEHAADAAETEHTADAADAESTGTAEQAAPPSTATGTETESKPYHVIHHSHRDVSGGWLRPAVFGAMDGLVSNLALMTGVAGGDVSTRTVVVTGMAGLAAGAFSMAAGEYTSVTSQRELVEAELAVERIELRRHPEDELRELAQLYVSRGVEPELAHEVARQLSTDPEQALEIHAREELGVDPTDLPSPLLAAGSSFVSFALGALLPVLPYLLGADALWPAVLLALVGLFGCGAAVARVTARSWWYGGLRQLALGGAAGGVTFVLGALIGGAVG